MSNERKPMANIPPFGLRMQPDLKTRVEDAARANNRSLNAEIIDRLERSFAADEERNDFDRLINFYDADQRYIEDEYLTGKKDDPFSDTPAGKPETELGKKVNRIISARTKTVGEIVVRELQKKGMIVAPGIGAREQRFATPDEKQMLRDAPPEVMPDVLEKLANHDVDGALLVVYRAHAKSKHERKT